jgi:hypothetical protein
MLVIINLVRARRARYYQKVGVVEFLDQYWMMFAWIDSTITVKRWREQS